MLELSTINLRDTLGWWFSMAKKKWVIDPCRCHRDSDWCPATRSSFFRVSGVFFDVFWICISERCHWCHVLVWSRDLLVRRIVILKQKGNQQLECVHSWWSTLIHLNSSPRRMFLTILSVSEPCESGKLLGYFEGPQCQNPTEGGRAVFSRLSWALSQTV